MALKRLNLTRGDSENYGVIFKKADGTLYNIKNWVVLFTLKTHRDLPDSQASLFKVVNAFSDSTSGTTGSANISILPSDTTNLAPGEYNFDISVCTNTSANYTVLKGKLDLEYDVTRSAGTAGTL